MDGLEYKREAKTREKKISREKLNSKEADVECARVLLTSQVLMKNYHFPSTNKYYTEEKYIRLSGLETGYAIMSVSLPAYHLPSSRKWAEQKWVKATVHGEFFSIRFHF